MRSSRSERLASGNEYSSHSVQDFTLAAEPDRGEVMALIARLQVLSTGFQILSDVLTPVFLSSTADRPARKPSVPVNPAFDNRVACPGKRWATRYLTLSLVFANEFSDPQTVSQALSEFYSTTTRLLPNDLPLGVPVPPCRYRPRPTAGILFCHGLGAWDLTPNARLAFCFFSLVLTSCPISRNPQRRSNHQMVVHPFE